MGSTKKRTCRREHLQRERPVLLILPAVLLLCTPQLRALAARQRCRRLGILLRLIKTIAQYIKIPPSCAACSAMPTLQEQIRARSHASAKVFVMNNWN